MPAQPFAIGSVVVDPPLVLAPMASVTLPSFRLLCRGYGAGLVCGEMISAMALRYRSPGCRRRLDIAEAERPVSLQIATATPETAAEAVAAAAAAGADVVDLNFGCPAPKVRRTGAGAVVLRDLGLARAIVEAAVAAAGPTPVTAKLRAGWDDRQITFLEVGRVAAESGCAALALHARTAEQGYGGAARWEWIRELVAEVPVPVIGNGDVHSPEDALRMFELTGCAGVMIGRAAQAAPWLFAGCAAALRGEPIPPEPEWPGKLAVALRLCEGLVDDVGERVGCLHARRALARIGSGIPGAARFRVSAHSVRTLDDVRRLIAYYARASEE
jgi:nifR3 family TIM-barrel protein